MTDVKPCGQFVHWWDGEYEGQCERPQGHGGPHFDGMSWFNDDNEEVKEPEVVEFLRARLDERQARAKAAAADPDIGPAWTAVTGGMVQVARWYLGEDDPFSTFPEPVAAHIAANDPAFVLADVAMKRRIIEFACDEDADDGLVQAERTIEGEWGSAPDLRDQLLKLLALPYVEHPAYWEGWRP